MHSFPVPSSPSAENLSPPDFRHQTGSHRGLRDHTAKPNGQRPGLVFLAHQQRLSQRVTPAPSAYFLHLALGTPCELGPYLPVAPAPSPAHGGPQGPALVSFRCPASLPPLARSPGLVKCCPRADNSRLYLQPAFLSLTPDTEPLLARFPAWMLTKYLPLAPDPSPAPLPHPLFLPIWEKAPACHKGTKVEA